MDKSVLCVWYTCIKHRFLCILHRIFHLFFFLTFKIHLEPKTKILAHFKASGAKSAFQNKSISFLTWWCRKYHWSIQEWSGISPFEPLKCAKNLCLGSKWKFNILPKIGKIFPCTVHINQCTMHIGPARGHSLKFQNHARIKRKSRP